MNSNDFQDLVTNECLKHHVETMVSDGDHVLDDGVKCNGFFDEKWGKPPQPVLAWHTGRPLEQWLPILIHEYNHMQQWLENDPTWIRLDNADDWFGWMASDFDLTDKQALESCLSYALCELNCDTRVVEMIKKLDLPLDPDYYTQTAHAYAWFYFWSLENRSWYVIDHEPYRTQAIVEAMPTTMVDPSKGEFTYDIYKRHYKSIFDRHMVSADQNTLFTE